MDLNRDKVRDLLADPAAEAVPLLVAFLAAFGEDAEGAAAGPIQCLGWDPTTVVHELAAEFGAPPSDANLNRLMAAIAILTRDGFFRVAADFGHLATALAGALYDPHLWEPPTAQECAWAITVALLLVPPGRGDHEPFSEEVRRYLGAVLREEGIADPPDVLRIAVLDPAMVAALRDNPDAMTESARKRDRLMVGLQSQFRAMLEQCVAIGCAANVEALLTQLTGRRPQGDD